MELRSGAGGSSSSQLPDCPICFRVLSPECMFCPSTCTDLFCIECMRQFLLIIVTDTHQYPIKCPSCQEVLSDEECIIVFNENGFEEVRDALTTLVLKKRNPSSIRYCSNPKCATPFEWCKEDSPASSRAQAQLRYRAVCPICDTWTCVICCDRWHEGLPCQPFSGEDGKKLLNLAKEKSWVRCDQCGHLIFKDGGCSHILCVCGHQFDISSAVLDTQSRTRPRRNILLDPLIPHIPFRKQMMLQSPPRSGRRRKGESFDIAPLNELRKSQRINSERPNYNAGNISSESVGGKASTFGTPPVHKKLEAEAENTSATLSTYSDAESRQHQSNILDAAPKEGEAKQIPIQGFKQTNNSPRLPFSVRNRLRKRLHAEIAGTEPVLALKRDKISQGIISSPLTDSAVKIPGQEHSPQSSQSQDQSHGQDHDQIQILARGQGQGQSSSQNQSQYPGYAKMPFSLVPVNAQHHAKQTSTEPKYVKLNTLQAVSDESVPLPYMSPNLRQTSRLIRPEGGHVELISKKNNSSNSGIDNESDDIGDEKQHQEPVSVEVSFVQSRRRARYPGTL